MVQFFNTEGRKNVKEEQRDSNEKNYHTNK